MMVLPEYWRARPPMKLDDQTRSAFDTLLMTIRSPAATLLIPYTLMAPKWQFLCYIVEHHAIVLHGTGDSNISTFEPRQPVDLNPFGNQRAVYAAGDGLWPMFYAIVDRTRYPMSINNACVRLAEETGYVSEPYYVFSISQTALAQQPWRTGFVYLLPSESFAVQLPQHVGAYEIRVPQFASPIAVTPLARLEILPDDFPFLSDIRGHEDTRLHEYAQAMQTGGPWPAS